MLDSLARMSGLIRNVFPMQKYQIFVSSTFEDLKPERDQVIKAILAGR